MAEIVVTAAVTVLIEKLLSGDLTKLARSEGIQSQLEKLTTKLHLVEALLADASKKHITQRAVRLWLQELHHLAYDIDDVLDDMATETMRRKFNDKSHGSTSTSKVLKIITNFTPRNMMYGRNMSSKLDKITIKLNDLFEQKNKLGLDINVIVENRSNRNSKRLEQTSLVEDSTVLGREVDQEALLSKLLRDEACNQNVSIVSIVGLGGIGKTTLAQLLYNNEKVKDHFELKAWVCVSDEFDVLAVSRAIYQAVAGEDKAFANLDLLHVALQEKLSNKRFLLVLDDVWNEDHEMWKILKKPLKGAPGSKIIVTTRKTTVASVMNSVEPHNLGILSEEHALSLFAKSALDEHNFDKHPSLLSVARSIIEKCDGLPLALIAIGRVLKGKGNDDDDEWEKLLNSEIWSSADQSDILPALKLSYYDLPLHLKQLFAYCSLFPKDYLFNKDKLVLLWMAEGFLSESQGNNSKESLGNDYFEELKSRSFFQQSTDNKSLYTMHDLVNDLAISVAGEFFFMLDDKMDLNGRNEAFDKFRHFSLTCQEGAKHGKLKELRRSRRLRTFLPVLVGQTYSWTRFNSLDGHVLVQLLPRLHFLRVLSLTRYSITEVPKSVGGLKHLRYLNFSYTNIKQVPEQVSELYNLQSLLVRGCDKLSRLPVSFAKLINLRHLDMSDTPLLNKTPLGIGGLTSLQTLTKVFIERENGFEISDLKGLLNLQGPLSIKGLEKVTDLQQAKDANLEGKKGLVCLDMEWSDVFDDSRDSMIEYEVIQRLRPHTKLNKLKILGYGGMKFPSWLVDPSFDKLTELRLKGCRNCKDFHSISFPSLEYLKITDMEVLEIRSTQSFPQLRKIHIENCPKLAKVSLGLIPSLEVLKIKRCSEAVLRAMVAVSSAIQRLEMVAIKGLTKLDGEVLKHLRAVEDLHIEECDELRYLWDSESEACRFLVKLQKLFVITCKMLVSMEEKEVTLNNCDSLESYNCPNSVEELYIEGCSSMTSLTLSTTLQELPSSLKSLYISNCSNLNSFPHELPSSLEYLDISNCSNLNSFPHERLQSLTSLEVMVIYNCESMEESFPCGLWPPNLRVLRIGELKKPMSEWGLQNYPTSLVELCLYGSNSGVVSFAMEEDASNTDSTSFLLPPSLTILRINNFKDVESISEVVLQRLTHLQELDIRRCPNIRDVLESTSSLEVYVNGMKNRKGNGRCIIGRGDGMLG